MLAMSATSTVPTFAIDCPKQKCKSLRSLEWFQKDKVSEETGPTA